MNKHIFRDSYNVLPPAMNFFRFHADMFTTRQNVEIVELFIIALEGQGRFRNSRVTIQWILMFSHFAHTKLDQELNIVH